MSTYDDFITVVNGLPSDTQFAVTCKWCTKQGLLLTPNMARSWGKQFAKEHGLHNVSNAKRNTSANLRQYTKM